VNGFNGAQNNFMIDGMDNNERFIATVTVKPSIEAIGEIRIITNTFSAELSRANGAGGVRLENAKWLVSFFCGQFPSV